jgi:hypothetical protein
MYRGHILAEWENIFDIADIDGNRRGGQDFFYALYFAQNRHDKGEKREVLPISIILSKNPLIFRGQSKIAKLSALVNSQKQVPEKTEKIQSESKY